MQKTQIKMIAVSSAAGKIEAICTRVEQHFRLGETVMLAMHNDDAARYVDELLWRHPPESFIPHKIVDGSSTEIIAVAIGDSNVNSAQIVINLRPDPFTDLEKVELLYDLYDETSPEKLDLSKKRRSHYESLSQITFIGSDTDKS